ncbi:MAG: hypothetical protein RLZZ555_520 [Pseudomonadota bacterium]|jgi:hypothetical protein
MSFDRDRLPDPASYFEAQGLRLTGPRSSKWRTTACPFHGGSDSMRVNIFSGAFCCMNCGARGGDVLAFEMALHGLEFVEAARRLGAWVDDGKTPTSASMRPAPLTPRAALEVLGFESLLVAVAADMLAKGGSLSIIDASRLKTCASRINRIAGYFA